MRIYFASSVGWLGCSTAAVAAMLSLNTAEVGEPTADPGGVAAPAVLPAAFSPIAGGRTSSSPHRGSGAIDWGGHGPTGANALGGSRGEGGSNEPRVGANHLRSDDDLPALELRSFGFRGTDFGELPVSLPTAPPPAPSGAALSFAVRSPPDAGSILLAPIQFTFPGLPNGVPSGTVGAGPAGTSSGSASYFYVIDIGQGAADGGDSGVEGYGAEAVPEPSSWALGGLAVGAAIYLRRRALRADF